MYPLTVIRQRLAEHRPATVDSREITRQAAVAMILREHEGVTEVLFIQRAEKIGDPWSGHMAFPGGHLEPSDAHLRAAAERETAEEIGLDLGPADYLGSLDQQHAMPRGRTLGLLIEPHVFELSGDPVFAPNHEVAEVVWAPLDALARGTCHDTRTVTIAGSDTVFNGYRLAGGHFVWGLTYRMLKTFFRAIDPEWQPPPEL